MNVNNATWQNIKGVVFVLCAVGICIGVIWWRGGGRADIPASSDVAFVRWKSNADPGNHMFIAAFEVPMSEAMPVYDSLVERTLEPEHLKWDIFGSLQFITHTEGIVSVTVYDLPDESFGNWGLKYFVTDEAGSTPTFYDAGKFAGFSNALRAVELKVQKQKTGKAE